jgi:DNA-binding MarR family transcriptional regulator
MTVMADDRNRAPWSREELPSSGIPQQHPITTALRDIDSHSRAFERRLASILTVNQTDLAAMQHLIQDGPLTPSELAARLKVTTAASTLVVDRLVALGHAERHPHAHDRRKIVVVPARESVQRAIDELLPVIYGIGALVEQLTPSERTTVERFLHGVDDVYRAAAEHPHP